MSTDAYRRQLALSSAEAREAARNEGAHINPRVAAIKAEASPYKPEGWPTAEDLEIMTAEEARDLDREIEIAVATFKDLVQQSRYFGFSDEAAYANARLVIAYRALKAWEAERG